LWCVTWHEKGALHACPLADHLRANNLQWMLWIKDRSGKLTDGDEAGLARIEMCVVWVGGSLDGALECIRKFKRTAGRESDEADGRRKPYRPASGSEVL